MQQQRQKLTRIDVNLSMLLPVIVEIRAFDLFLTNFALDHHIVGLFMLFCQTFISEDFSAVTLEEVSQIVPARKNIETQN